MNSNYREKNHEIGILWNDKNLKIKWPIKEPILSKKDSKNISFEEYCDKYN
jgi:dTDP-4-dehydrorhamnose 3,5-epimerase